MAFKSYSWSIGTTSFRTSQLNYKIERQIQLMDDFWKSHVNSLWNSSTQVEYYKFLQSEEFVQGNATRPDKDAREKTSGLVNLGLLDCGRKLTEVGTKLRKMLDEGFLKENVFMIPNDSYLYLTQFLKMQIDVDDIKVKPFVSLIYMLEKLEYLSFEEFTYLLPLCKNKSDVKEMVSFIKSNRLGLDIDEIIRLKIFEMPNYLESWNFFSQCENVTEETFKIIGMSRKSKDYDVYYNDVYQLLLNLVLELRNSSVEERLVKYRLLFKACDKISGKAKSMWKKYLFNECKFNKIDVKFDLEFKKSDIFKEENLTDFKRSFFEKLHIFKWKINLQEYFDLNRRYFSLTDILKFDSGKIELDLLPKYYFSSLIDSMIDEPILANSVYEEKFHKYTTIEEISDIYNIDINIVVDNINSDLGINLDKTTINSYIETKKIEAFNKLIDEKFTSLDITKLLDQINKRDDENVMKFVTDNASIPTIFEYILGIAWYRISNKKGNILKYMNLSLDADFLPKTHAGGGMADIVYEYSEDLYPGHNLLLEATLSESTGQRIMEMEPVSRHLGENIKQTSNRNNYAIFVASTLDERVILDFRNMKTRSYPIGDGEYTTGLKIIPIDINMLKLILEKNLTYDYIYTWFDAAFNSTEPDPIWYKKEILQKI